MSNRTTRVRPLALPRFLCSLVVMLALAFPLAPASAESFEEGLTALRANQAPQAEAIWLTLANRGDGQAQYALGTLYEQGHPGVPQDLAKAVIWYRKASEQGVAAAENNLALMYATGRGVERDPAQALALWNSAADKGHVQAQYNAGLAFFRGSGAERDVARASQLFQKAAAGGLADSQYALAQMYRMGIGVPRNAKTSLFWYEQAAAQGHASSQREAAELREAGIVLDGEGEAEARVAAVRTEAPAKTQAATAPKQAAATAAKSESRKVQAAQTPAAQTPTAEKPAAEKPAAKKAAAEPASKTQQAAQKPATQKPASQQPASQQQAAKTSKVDAAKGYGLWIGTADNRKAAESLWGDLNGRNLAALAEKDARFEPSGQGGASLRVYATAWPDRASAVKACLVMKEADPAIFCAPVALK